MAILLIILLVLALIFTFYYELLWKRVEKKKGKNLLSMLFSPLPKKRGRKRQDGDKKPAARGWDDWKYRVWVELHRRSMITAEQAASVAGVRVRQAERYLDKLESEGRVAQAGDAERGIFYKVIEE